MSAPNGTAVSPETPDLVVSPAPDQKNMPAISDNNRPPADCTVSPDQKNLPAISDNNRPPADCTVSPEPPELDIPEQPAAAPAMPGIWQGPPPAPEHPEADAIRKQVEFYFSDENLPQDEHLLAKCGNHDNLPVSIRSICGFKKMRRFKPYLQVVAALKKSAYLDVVEGNKIKRKIPLIARTVLDKTDDPDSDLEGEGVKEKPKSEKKASPPKKPQQPKQEKQPKPTGFEEWYAEPPMDPKEYQEEVEMYDPGIPFRLRMETAMQRYKMRRKFQSVHTQAFDRLMRFGGVDIGQRQFTGGPKDPLLDEHDAAERALMLATHQIDDSREDETRWVVDFEGIAKGFLSCHYPYWVTYQPSEIKHATTLMRSFYNYLQHHNVCPEYNSQLNGAKAVCDQADSEYARIFSLNTTLPGPFNMACSNLIGGYYADKWVKPGTWDDTLDPNDLSTTYTSISTTEARFVFKLATFIISTTPNYTNLAQTSLLTSPDLLASAPIQTLDGIGLRVTQIIQPTQAAIDLYAAANARYTLRRELQPLGQIRCVPFPIDPFLEPDIPVSERRARRRADKTRVYEFWIEKDLLDEMFVGLRMQACVKRVTLLAEGAADGVGQSQSGSKSQSQTLEIIDQVLDVVPSFYVCLENELLDNWKEPRWYDDDEREALEGERAEMPAKKACGGGKDGCGVGDAEGGGGGGGNAEEAQFSDDEMGEL